MGPQDMKETSRLLSDERNHHLSMNANDEDDGGSYGYRYSSSARSLFRRFPCRISATLLILLALCYFESPGSSSSKSHDDASRPSPFVLLSPTGPYKLVESQVGRRFFDHYEFYEGADSLGSAGYNVYVGEHQAWSEGLVNVTRDESTGEDFIFIQSSPSSSSSPSQGMRDSVRLEGKRRFDRGLFVLDLHHVPTGCGVWPALWLTDEAAWPDHGEIDVVEGVNAQSAAKTALHAAESCSMYAHVSPRDMTGRWDSATGIPNTWTGKPDLQTSVEADDCWVMAPHQWANQGCVAISNDNETLGEPLNQKGGGVFVLEWDPANGYIKSWVFAGHETVPDNLKNAIETASSSPSSSSPPTVPNPGEWGLPYAHFAIGEGSGCSADHFSDMRIVVNLAFCGTVSGNRFLTDCPADHKFRGRQRSDDPVASCNAYVASNPKALEEQAYWKIRGIHVFEREVEFVKEAPHDKDASGDAN